MPNLCRAVQALEPAHSWSVAEVIGQVSGKPLGEYVKTVCGEQAVVVERVELRHLPPAAEEGKGGEGRRGEVLGDNGTFLFSCYYPSSLVILSCG
jgi:hypothetical protein